MNSYHDYESMGYLDLAQRNPSSIEESFTGTSIVGWYGKIRDQLINMLNEAEKGRNFVYADKLREFLKIWRANEITGSINRETLEPLKSSAGLLGVDKWKLSAYFNSLNTELSKLIASQEQLPAGAEDTGNDPYAGMGGGGGGGGRGAPPMSPDFGVKGDEAPDLGGPAGAEEPIGGAGGGAGDMGGPAIAGEPAPAGGEQPASEEPGAPGEPGEKKPEDNEEEIGLA